MIIKDLYTYDVKAHGDQTIEASITINEKCTLYEGHFPRFAITPGVCQVLMIREILEGEFGMSLRLQSAKYIKFTAIHEPGKVKEIRSKIMYKSDGERFLVEGLLYKDKTGYLKLKGEFIKQEKYHQGNIG